MEDVAIWNEPISIEDNNGIIRALITLENISSEINKDNKYEN